MDDLREDLPMSMTMAAFTGISWYIGVEVNVSLFMLFQRRRGLYFWSCALASWGVILQSLFIILADFGVWRNLRGAITMIYLTWLIMVVPQSWILYSRLHLIMQKKQLLRPIRFVLLFTSVVFSVPTVVIGILSQATNVNPNLRSFNITWDRIQLTVFFVQEAILSLLYIYETRKYLHSHSFLRRASASTTSPALPHAARNGVLLQLLYANVLIIALDIALVGIQYGDSSLFYLQGAFKPCVYGIKLKIEFIVLNRLIKSVKRSATDLQLRQYPQTGSSGPTLLSGQARSRGLSTDLHKPKGARQPIPRQMSIDDMEQGKFFDVTKSREADQAPASRASEGSGAPEGQPDRWEAIPNTSWLH
ncbi:hypothetical protein B0I35DRAFT_356475 [Stachybotrys elegans]|uniref:DUF7703 domain-containing protein n=1 Tax=Stachybotrys elegans TaxID=80388 RepID=A0A8K0SNL5_9HYPO|nr:hypothetical protein B0I35DRAFT_356475 [Stachybotrys elegans]